MTNLSENERKAIEVIRQRIMRLGAFFATHSPPESDAAPEWFTYLAMFKDELGNINNDVSFFATLLAQAYLVRTFDLIPFDAAAKAQGAPGLDVDELTIGGTRIVAEIKTTHPYKANDLGAQQLTMFQKDAAKLQRQCAEHKFFFLTDRATFEVMKRRKYQELFRGIRIVLLPYGEEINPAM